jgi:osmotically-inducible protein OsmY
MKINLKLILLVSILSAGCQPALFLASSAAISSIISDQRTIQSIQTDKLIKEEIMDSIYGSDLMQQKTHVNIISIDQQVLLIGQVMAEKQTVLCTNIAKKHRYVKKVYNLLEIAAPTTPTIRAHDAWITLKIKGQLIANPLLKSSQILVQTENSIVYLVGIINKHHVPMVVDIAKKVFGVKKVIKFFI